MVEKASEVEIRGDRRIGGVAEDRLGFREASANLAKAINSHSSVDGLVVGLEGKWGSGKSSLLFLIEAELKSLPDETRPTVVNFRPWLVGSRDGLLAYLFTELGKAIAEVERQQGNATKSTAIRAKEAGEALRKFAAGIGQVGGIIEIAGDATGFVPVKLIGKGFSWLRNLDKKPEPQLDKLKEKLVTALRHLGHRFVITIDDVDRLEPDEIIEVLRLTRSVADFPNVTYVLCYDSEVLAEGIEHSAKVKDGKAYLEKLVQLTVMVPQPEPFQLRNWFAAEIANFMHPEGDARERLREVIDYEGGRQLKTPRSVNKVLDSLRFAWPPLSELGADAADLTWLLLIKDGNPRLYRWIEDYCGTMSAISLGIARVEEDERSRKLDELLNCLPNDHFSDLMYRHHFSEQLPGVNKDFEQDGKRLKIFQKFSDHDRDLAIQDRRLASPDHYRLYFALGLPSHALSQADYDIFWTAAEAGVEELSALLLEWHLRVVTGGLSKAEVLLERIHALEPVSLDALKSMNLLAAFASSMDHAFDQRPFDTSRFNTIWDRCERLLVPLLKRMDPNQRASAISNMFGQGRAIGWLTSILRRETFAHGIYGERPKPEYEWYFSKAEYDGIAATMLKRYQSLTLTEILATPLPISLLFAWRQIGDNDGPRNLVSQETSSDERLVEVLESLTSVRSSSERGRYSVLTQDNVSPFIDFAEAAKRISRLTSRSDDLGIRAKRLSLAFDSATED